MLYTALSKVPRMKVIWQERDAADEQSVVDEIKQYYKLAAEARKQREEELKHLRDLSNTWQRSDLDTDVKHLSESSQAERNRHSAEKLIEQHGLDLRTVDWRDPDCVGKQRRPILLAFVRTHNIKVKKATVKEMVPAIGTWMQARPCGEDVTMPSPPYIPVCKSKDLRAYLVLRLKMFSKVIFAEKIPAEIEAVFMPNLPESRAIALTTHRGRTLPDAELLQHVRRCVAAEPSRPASNTAPQQPIVRVAAVAATATETGLETVAEAETRAETEVEADVGREVATDPSHSPNLRRPTRPSRQRKRARSAPAAATIEATRRQRQRHQHNQRSDKSKHRGAQVRQQGGGIPLAEGLAQIVREEVTRSGRKRRAVTYTH